MTREEARTALGDRNNLLWGMSKEEQKYYSEALDMAISALSAEPCREADDYENEIADLHNRLDIAEYDKERYKEEITTLEAKNKGEWQHDGSHWKNRFICSECGYKLFDEPTNFCPNCGADMRGE